MFRMMAVYAALLLASMPASADSGRARDRDGQITEPSAAVREKARKKWLEKITVERLAAAIRDILKQQEGKSHPVIDLRDLPPKRP